MNEIPRRNQVNKMKPAELAIREAIAKVEEMPADTYLVCEELQRKWIGIELNPTYAQMARKRIDYAIQEGAGQMNWVEL